MNFQKETIQKGNGLYTPVTGSCCRLKVKCDDNACHKIGFKGIKFNEVSEIILGEWDDDIDSVIHSSVESMVEDEVCEIEIDVENAVSVCSDKSSDPSIRVNYNDGMKQLKLEITLCSYVKGTELWEMSTEDRLDAAFHHKSRGTDSYKNADKCSAFRRFSQAAKYLISLGKEEDIPTDLRTKWKTLSTQVYLNMAACQLHGGYHEAVIENCSKALAMDENNVKGYFRRAQSLCKINDFDKAKNDLLHAQKLEPSNTAVERLLKDVESGLNAKNAKMANAMSKMFSS